MITILFDGRCGYCRRTVRILRDLDWFGRIHFVDYHDEELRRSIAPGIPLANLDHTIHMLFPGGQIERGFDAYRRLSWHVPPLWPAAPLLYVPGVPLLGRRIVAWIAKHRRCRDDRC